MSRASPPATRPALASVMYVAWSPFESLLPFRNLRMRPLRARSYLVAALALGVASTVGAVETPAAWSLSRQMIVVTTADWNVDHGQLRTYERDGSTWKVVGSPVEVTIGKNGSAWGIGLHPPQSDAPAKIEGDGRSPAGIFRV